MNNTLRNVLAVIAGWFGGSIINLGLVTLGHSVWPIEGIDPNNMEALAEVMPSLEPKYFIFPFLAHAIGTLFGGFLASIFAASYNLRLAFIVGGVFLLGGIAANFMLAGPVWFTATDILLAYIPMAWLGGILALRIKAN